MTHQATLYKCALLMNEETFDDLNRLPRRQRAVVFALNAVPMSLNKQTSIVEELIHNSTRGLFLQQSATVLMH